ncbi:efflux RND transporter periplasmic adaptor subunit [Legionella antarctica]|nr:efflux RND transporter periplasmic adaptor subunit [Legionella antarctica]
MNFDRNSKQVKIGIVIAIIFLLYLFVHHFSKSKPTGIPLPAVIVEKPIEAEMAEYVTQTGTTVAFNSVNLVARIEGYLESIKFTDGTNVKKGTELFVIQPQSYLEKLKAAQATVAASKAAYAYDKSEYARQKRMYKENATSLNNVEKWLAQSQASEAQVNKAIADEAIAAINYSYTHVSAPFDGRIGRHLVDVGNLVGNGKATDLATIEQVDTLYIYFNLNELDLLKLRKAALARGFKPKDINQVIVDINLQNETGFRHKAKLNFINTGLNAATGTMELRALLDNKDHIFVPGLFVQVRVPITKPEKQLTVPDASLLYDQIGPYLLVVDDNNVVVLKRVSLGSLQEGMRAITKGLDAQNRVIIGGLQNATPGNKVQIQDQKKTAE